MQKSEQYWRFADTLMAAAQTADAQTRELLLEAAEAWRTMAATAEPDLDSAETVVDFAQAAHRLRLRSA
jgi:protein-disulfide isomerase